MTYGAIEQEVRTLVNDTAEPYRFRSQDIWRFTAKAVSHLRTVQSSERYGDNGLIDDSIPVPASDADIRISRKYEDAIVKYAAYQVYELDMTDTVNLQIAEALKARAETLMQL